MKGIPSAAVTAQWRHLMLMERLGEREARRLLASSLKSEAENATARLRPLEEWAGIPARNYRVHSRGSNHVRAVRMLDYVADGDRVLDIGVNYGYLSGILLRERRLERYWGIDLTREQIASVHEMARRNELDEIAVRLDVKDLYQLTPEEVAAYDPTVVLLLEVLEHVPDAERALGTIARATPDHADLVFSVPILGRLEGCWGHLSVFDAHRIASMCANTGLTVHNVEALHNAWVVVLAGRSAVPSVRVRALQEAEGRRLAQEPAALDHYRLEPVPVGAITASDRWSRGTVDSGTHSDEDGVACRARALEGGRGAYAGLAFDVQGLSLLRLELSFPRADAIAAFHVDAYRDDGSRCVRWSWRRDQGEDLPGDKTTFVLRPGQAARMLSGSQGRDGREARRLHAFVAIDPGGAAEFRLHRAAVIG